ncbi:MAG: lysylphosphatidylglycerol synthase transmembrane domain-containing protein [Deferrisomatales bacterium]|nr:lysylphosphatidylglycerol synthase transmembrane domain-containing protein [Deferrisomatales bacterium]
MAGPRFQTAAGSEGQSLSGHSPSDRTAPGQTRRAVQAAALAVLSTGVVLLLVVPRETFANLHLLPWNCAPGLIGLVACAWLCNAGRVAVLCRSLGCAIPYREALAVSLAAEFGLAATPAGTGGAMAYFSLLRRAGVPYATTATLLAADVVVDLCCFLGFTTIAGVLLLRDSTWLPVTEVQLSREAMSTGLCVLLVLGLFVALAWWAKGRPLGSAYGAGGPKQGLRPGPRLRGFRARLRREWRHTCRSMLFLARWRRTALIANFVLALVQWSCRFAVLPVLLLIMGSEWNPLPLLFLQAPLTLFSLAMVVPGGGGSVEFVSSLALQGCLSPAEVGAVLMLWRGVTHHLYLLAGALALAWLLRGGRASVGHRWSAWDAEGSNTANFDPGDGLVSACARARKRYA